MKVKRAIRLMRHAGLVLIALPEPVTTALGVALVLFSRYLSRRLEASLNQRLREMLRRYLANLKRFKDSLESARLKRAPGKKAPLPSPDNPHQGGEPPLSNPAPIASQAKPPMVYHAIDMERLSRYYGTPEPARSPARERTVYHSLNTSLLSPPELKKKPVKPVHHAIDMESLLRRYGSPLPRTAIRAR